MVGRIIFVMVAACVVGPIIFVAIVERPWLARPAEQPNATVPVPHFDRRAAENNEMRHFLSGPLPPPRGYKQW